MLSAVGLDGNDQMVPIAWAIVDKENKNNWRWFIAWLKQELSLEDGSHLTIISDMKKVCIILIYLIFVIGLQLLLNCLPFCLL